MLKHDNAHFSTYPTKRVVAFIDERGKADKAVIALEKLGFDSDEIDESFGEDGLHFLDPDAQYHGLWPKIVRQWQNLANGEEKKLFDLIRSELNQGHVLVSVPAPDEASRQHAKTIFQKHGAHDIRYYGQLIVEDLIDEIE